MASLKNNTESADIFGTDTNIVPAADKKGVIVYTNELLRAYSRLSEDAGIGLSVGDLIPNAQGEAAGRIRFGKAINGRRLEEKKACVVAKISPNIGQREVFNASIGFNKLRNDYEQFSNPHPPAARASGGYLGTRSFFHP